MLQQYHDFLHFSKNLNYLSDQSNLLNFSRYQKEILAKYENAFLAIANSFKIHHLFLIETVLTEEKKLIHKKQYSTDDKTQKSRMHVMHSNQVNNKKCI